MSLSSIHRSRFLALAVLASVALGAPCYASARSAAASLGRPVSPAEASCFGLTLGAVTNNCSGARNLEFPLAMDTTGNKTVRVNVSVPTPANTVGCMAQGFTPDISAGYGSGMVYPSAFGPTAQTLVLNGAYVLQSGQELWRVHVSCQLNNGGRINTVNWTP